ncbi:MAG: hypothetical protein A3J27_11110 [Candidatus Tectomicrobia bacterium RIFCSPLOWO2_12_FULL_69_37]|nr:MAG: hypothetical protein A3I72_01065 [Candidatus Tectomicrobia bacterium RIFCSPLOWO2_02_FULL_70_19]OGL64578.1 MAG: hypothetical protein A3J27_11110 [Candidatus Tectomicrobia bacterium RIFCSPLOWO2_12_FULL_69_37]
MFAGFVPQVRDRAGWALSAPEGRDLGGLAGVDALDDRLKNRHHLQPLAPARLGAPALAAASMARLASAAVKARGFSTKMCFPAEAAWQMISAWVEWGVAMITPSTPGSLSTSSRLPA